jgi:RNA polymerase sigma factor (sigma-70 family)
MDRQHGTRDSEPGPDQAPPDRELIDRVRAGDLEAYDPLYRRHARSALLHARHWARTEAAAEDLRAEAFTRVLYAIRNGNGPTEAFRPYLLTTMRHVARDWAEGDRRLLLMPDLVDLEAPEPEEDPVIAALERSLAGQAFMALPERWQMVLWHTAVEGESAAQLAAELEMEPAAVSALSYRAREALKQEYLQAHITEVGAESCRPFAEKLGAAARGKLGPREKGKVQGHLRHCVECTGLLAMLKYVNGHIGVLVAPAVVGTAVATKTLLLVVAGATAGGSTGSAHAGLLARGLSKAKHASPRQQAVAATTTAAVAAAALAFALSGGSPAPPAAKPSSSPVAAPPPSAAPSPPLVVVSASPSASASPSPAASSPSPRPTPSRPHHTPPPSSPAPSPSPSPSASPSASPSPSHVMCPGISFQVLGVQLRFAVEVDLTLNGQRILLVALPACGGGGPPTPF